MLREAKDAGLLRDEGFPSLGNRRANAEELNEHMAEILGREAERQPEVPYVDVLIGTSPYRAADPDATRRCADNVEGLRSRNSANAARFDGAHCEAVNRNKCSDWNRSGDLRY